MTALAEVRREIRRGQAPPASFDDWEAWIDSGDPREWFSADPPRVSPPEPDPSHTDAALNVAVRVDLVIGEFFRGKWRRRLVDAQGDYGYVARQMRKSGVPLDLALAILLMPEELLPTVHQCSHTGRAAQEPAGGELEAGPWVRARIALPERAPLAPWPIPSNRSIPQGHTSPESFPAST
jgi:hypothetical protein